MTDNTGKVGELKRTDKKLLADALRSNGGGVDVDLYPEASWRRLIKRGLIQWKPNQEKSKHYTKLLTLTGAGKIAARQIAALATQDKSNG